MKVYLTGRENARISEASCARRKLTLLLKLFDLDELIERIERGPVGPGQLISHIRERNL